MHQVSQGVHTVWIILLWAIVIFEGGKWRPVSDHLSAEKKQAGTAWISCVLSEDHHQKKKKKKSFSYSASSKKPAEWIPWSLNIKIHSIIYNS